MKKDSEKEWRAICRGNQRWGPFCIFHCPENCLSGCDYSDGTCNRGICKKGYVGLKCDRISTEVQMQKAEADGSSNQMVFPGFTIAFIVLSSGGIAVLCYVVFKDKTVPKLRKSRRTRRQSSLKLNKQSKTNSTIIDLQSNTAGGDTVPKRNKSPLNMSLNYCKTFENRDLNQFLSSLRQKSLGNTIAEDYV